LGLWPATIHRLMSSRRSRREASRRRIRQRRAVLAVVGASLVVVAIWLAAAGGDVPGESAARVATKALPPPVTPAFVPGPARGLSGRRSQWAAVRRSVDARTRPSESGAIVARVPTTTAEGTRNIVAVISHRDGAEGAVW